MGAKGLHPGHNMMRMASAQGTWPHHIFKRIDRMQERAVNREKCRERGEEDKEAKDENKTENNTWGRRGFRGGRCGMRGRAFQGPNPFEAMMKGWMGAGGMPQCADNEEMKKQHEEGVAAAKAAHEAAHKAATEAAKAMHGGNADFLMNVGNYVAAALDHGGVNVDVSVESPDGVRTHVSSSSSSSSSSTKNDEEPTEKRKKPRTPKRKHLRRSQLQRRRSLSKLCASRPLSRSRKLPTDPEQLLLQLIMTRSGPS